MKTDKSLIGNELDGMVNRIASGFEIGDFIKQSSRYEDSNIYGIVIGKQSGGGEKVVAISEGRGVAAVQSTKGWFPNPSKIKREEIPGRLLMKIENKAAKYLGNKTAADVENDLG